MLVEALLKLCRPDQADSSQHFPPILLALLAVYVPSFLYSLSQQSPYDVLSDEIKIVTREPANDEELVKDLDSGYVNGNASKEIGQEFDVEEVIVVEEKDPEIVKTLLTGLPSPSSLLWSGITFGINILLFLLAMDLVYRAVWLYPSHDLSIARVGYVSDTTAMIVVRQADQSRLPVFVSYRHAGPPSKHSSETATFATRADEPQCIPTIPLIPLGSLLAWSTTLTILRTLQPPSS